MQGIDQNTSFPDLLRKFSEESESSEPNTVSEVLEADSKAAETISMPDPLEIDKKVSTESNLSGDIEDNHDSEPDFTMNASVAPKAEKNFLDVEWNKAIKNPFEKKPENKEGTVEKKDKAPLQLQVDLRNALDQYGELVSKAVRLKKDIEAKGGVNGEISTAAMRRLIEDPELEDPRVKDVIQLRIYRHLRETVKNEDTKAEVDQYQKIVSQIEPVKDQVSDALSAVLAKTSDRFDAEKIRLSIASLVVEDDVTISHKQDWDAICTNRKAEIDEQANTKEETIDQLPGVQPGIIEGITKLDPEEDKNIEAKKNQLPGVSPAIIKQIDTASLHGETIAGAGTPVSDENGIRGEKPQTEESAVINDEPKAETDKDNVYADVVEKSIDANQESTDEAANSIDSNSEISADKPEQQAIATDSAPEAPQPAKFVQFATVDGKGIVSQDESGPHPEVDLDPNVTLDATALASLEKGDGVPKGTGVVNLATKDLKELVPINKKDAIRERLKELQNAEQTIDPDFDIFGLDKEKPIRDITDTPIVPDKDDVANMDEAESKAPAVEGKVNESQESIEIKTDSKIIEEPEQTKPDTENKENIQPVPDPEAPTEAEKPKELKLDPQVLPYEKGPDLVAKPSGNTGELAQSSELPMPEAKPSDNKEMKKKSLSQIFGKFLRLKNKNIITTNMIAETEEKVRRIRSTGVEEAAEQAEK